MNNNSLYPLFFLFTVVFVIVAVIRTCNKDSEEKPFSVEQTSYDTRPIITIPKDNNDTVSSMTTTDSTSTTAPAPVKSTDNSESPTPSQRRAAREPNAYDEGYMQGYEDGESDAISEDGWQASYDSECHYKGSDRRQYKNGYDDGYGDGYYDNKSGEE